MDKFDEFLNEKPAPQSTPKKAPSKDNLWNLLTILMLLMTLCSCIYFVSVISNPASSLNLFPPNTVVPPPPTATWTPVGFAPTWTPTVTLPPTDTNTPRPTFTLEASSTPYRLMTSTPFKSPTVSATPTRTAHPTGAPYSMTFQLMDRKAAYKPSSDCSSMYVAGRVLDSNNTDVSPGWTIKVGGALHGKSLGQLITLVGLDKVYGPSGFEIPLGVAPVASTGTVTIQLFGLADAPLSDVYKLNTSADCKQDLVFVLFKQK